MDAPHASGTESSTGLQSAINNAGSLQPQSIDWLTRVGLTSSLEEVPRGPIKGVSRIPRPASSAGRPPRASTPRGPLSAHKLAAAPAFNASDRVQHWLSTLDTVRGKGGTDPGSDPPWTIPAAQPAKPKSTGAPQLHTATRLRALLSPSGSWRSRIPQPPSRDRRLDSDAASVGSAATAPSASRKPRWNNSPRVLPRERPNSLLELLGWGTQSRSPTGSVRSGSSGDKPRLARTRASFDSNASSLSLHSAPAESPPPLARQRSMSVPFLLSSASAPSPTRPLTSAGLRIPSPGPGYSGSSQSSQPGSPGGEGQSRLKQLAQWALQQGWRGSAHQRSASSMSGSRIPSPLGPPPRDSPGSPGAATARIATAAVDEPLECDQEDLIDDFGLFRLDAQLATLERLKAELGDARHQMDDIGNGPAPFASSLQPGGSTGIKFEAPGGPSSRFQQQELGSQS